MKLYTEKDLLFKSQEFSYKLRNLFATDKNLFHQVNDYIPFSVFTNRQDNLNITYSNHKLEQRGKELENLIEIGGSYLPEISCPILLKRAKQKAENFKHNAGENDICSYLQNLTTNGCKKYFYANKLFLDTTYYFNVGLFTEDLGLIDTVFKSVFDPVTKSEIAWKKFLSLSKQEKIILRLLAKGHTSNSIADFLFISTHTVQTHRKNIFKKLDTNKISELVHFATVLELI